MLLFLASVMSCIVARRMFRKPMAEARQIKDTKKTELRRIRCEKAIVYRNWI